MRWNLCSENKKAADENVTNFKYLGETRTKQNAFHEEILSNQIPGIFTTNALGIFFLPAFLSPY